MAQSSYRIFLSCLINLKTATQFTAEIESDSESPFFDVLIIRKETTLATIVYRKPTHTERYINFNSNNPQPVK
jgi:hypothetical protein